MQADPHVVDETSEHDGVLQHTAAVGVLFLACFEPIELFFHSLPGAATLEIKCTPPDVDVQSPDLVKSASLEVVMPRPLMKA